MRILTIAALALVARPLVALTVDEVVAKNVAARGGRERLKAIRSIRTTGRLVQEFGDTHLEAQWAQVVARPGKYRSEVTLQGLTIVNAYDGHDGWLVQPFQGRKDAERASVDVARSLAQQADLDGPLVDWREKGHAVDFLGTEDVDGTSALKLRVSLKDGDTEYIWLDPISYLDIKTEVINRIRGTENVTDTDLGGYELVDGVWIPFTVDQGPKGAPRGVHYAIERVETNVDAPDALFGFPGGGAPVARALFAGPAPEGRAASPGSPGLKAAASRPAALDAGVLSGLGARNIGSAAMGGRVSAIAGRVEKGRTTLFVGAASGGVWRSRDGGVTFDPVFDKQPVQSIGAVAIDPSSPKTVWVGTGESWVRNSVSAGDGIYRSTDEGETWTNMGLPGSERIVRVLVHPKRSEVVYACVPGRLWSDSADRGVYRTTDGGKTWDHVLKGANLSTGCSSLTMDAQDPDVLLAGLWDFRRKGWTFRSGGEGPKAASASGLFRTSDGGRTWIEITSATGLPPKPWGRVEAAIAPSSPKVVYALVESPRSALFRSSDGGKTWEEGDRSRFMVWRPFYFGKLVVDPTNAERLFKPGGLLIVSDDGGKSFAASVGGNSHVDWHDVWIDPENPAHVVAGNDGGLWISNDGGSRWLRTENLPISQAYHVTVDDRDPYQLYAGFQDNSCWVGDSAHPGGVSNARWQPIPAGDGFCTFPDPADPDVVFAESQGGGAIRFDRRTGSARDIQPKAGYKEKLRFNWNTPLLASSGRPGTLYIGAQLLFRSSDQGETWERVSPDLTTNDPEKQKQEQSGGVTVDNSAAEMHTTITAIAESPLDPDLLWVGTDDGNLQLSTDGGKTWTNTAPRVEGLPPSSWVSFVEPSRTARGTAYATFDRHTFGDFQPWAYRTSDFGRTWTRVASPEKGIRGWAHVLREDPLRASLLYLGTELGLFVSGDGGATWAEFKGGDFPSVSVRDLAFQRRDDDLVIATHGRGLWIVDDLAALRALTAETLAEDAAFLPSRPAQQRMPSIGGWQDGDAVFTGQNPAGGATVSYYQREPHLFGRIKLEVLDASGKVIDTLSASKRRGVNRVSWSMQEKPPRVPRAASLAFQSSVGPRLPPGTYTVRLTKGSKVYLGKVEVVPDRRAPYAAADRRAQYEAVMKAHALFGEMSALVDRIDAAKAEAVKDAKLAARLDEIKKKVVATKEGGDITGEERIREHLDAAYGALMSWEGRPAPGLLERVEALRKELEEVKAEFEEEARGLTASRQTKATHPRRVAVPAAFANQS